MQTLSFRGWTVGSWALVTVLLTVPIEAQRQRVPPADQSAAESRTAREREASARAAQARPPAPPSTPAPQNGTATVPPLSTGRGDAGGRGRGDTHHDGRRGDHGPRGEVDRNGFVRPTIVRPVIVSPVIVQPVILPSPSSVHRELERRRDARDWPYDRSDYSYDDATQAGSIAPASGGTFRGYAPALGAAAVAGSAPADQPSGFLEWYAVTEHVSAGFPIPYPEEYTNTYDRAQFTNRLEGGEPAGTGPAAANGVVPGAPLVPYEVGNFGGLTFDMTPGDALVFVNGLFVGSADDYAPGGPPLPLPATLHKVQLRARGLQTETFEVTVPLGQVMPLRGTLRRAGGR